MLVSVVVVSYRPHQWLERCWESAIANGAELVVVDNGSRGEIAARARPFTDRIVELPENVGFPGGVNAGVAATGGDLVALLNDDAFARPGWLATAAHELRDPTIGAVCPKLLFAPTFAAIELDDEPRFVGADPRPLGRMVSSVTVAGDERLPSLVGPGIHELETGEHRGEPATWRWTAGPRPIYVPVDHADEEIRVDGDVVRPDAIVRLVNNAGSYLSQRGFGGDFGYGAVDDGRFDQPADRFGVCGAAVVARRETFLRDVGGLASWFFAYYEDLDWSWRVQLAGLRVRYAPAGVVDHIGGVTSGGPAADRVLNLAGRNRLACLARNAPLAILRQEVMAPDHEGLRPTNVAPAVARALVERVGLRRRWHRSPRDVWAQWAGVGESWD